MDGLSADSDSLDRLRHEVSQRLRVAAQPLPFRDRPLLLLGDGPGDQRAFSYLP